MAIKTYDPKAIQVIIGGQQIAGFADGEFVNIERDEDMFTKVSGADGEISRAKSNNKMATMTLTLLGTSSSNDILSGFATADERDNDGVVPIYIKDSLGTSTLFAAEGWIRKLPAYVASKEITERAWTLDLAQVDGFIGGNA